MEGWVSIHRQIMDHWIYKERKPFSKREAWFDLILLANHCDTTFPLGNEIIEAKRGQVITSEVKLMDRWMWSKTKLRSFLTLLEDDGMIVKKSDRKKTTIDLMNYGNFQDTQTIEKPIKDHEETAKRLQKDTINNDNNLIIKDLLSASKEIAATKEDEPVNYYNAHKNAFGFYLYPRQNEILGAYIDHEGVAEAVVIRAIERAAEKMRGPYKFGFIETILKDYINAGARTLEMAVMLDQEFEKGVSGNAQGNQGFVRHGQNTGNSTGNQRGTESADAVGYYEQYPGVVQRL